MTSLNPYSLGILFVALGLAFWIAARLLMAAASRNPAARPAADGAPQAGASPEAGAGSEAVLVVSPGGRLGFVNQAAHHAFRLLPGETPHLERLSKRVRPSEAFLDLCTGEGRAQLVLNGRRVEGVSRRLELQPEPVLVVSFRPPDALAERPDGLGAGGQALITFTEFTQSIAENLDLEATLRAILEGVEKLLPTDFLEVSTWDAATETFTAYRFIGMPDFERKLERIDRRFRLGEGLAGELAQQRKAVRIPDLQAQPGAALPDAGLAAVRSYIGAPLLVGSELVGTLELGSTTPDALSSEDLELARLIAGQAAVALHNAVLYRSEQRRSAELYGLAQLTQAFSSVRDPKGLFARLVQSIVPLLPVEILGFLLYNESQRCLEGQVPYYGLPAQFMELYRVRIQPGSLAEQALLGQEAITSENAAEDPHWAVLGFDRLAQGASLRDSVLMPLVSSGRMLGYLQASNHADGSRSFTQDELRLLTIVANQAAPLIENATLVQQTRQRAQRAEALRRITSLASSAANLDEILLFSLQELARLLQADVAAAFLVDPGQSVMQCHSASIYGSPPPLEESKSALLVNDPQFPFTAAGSLHASSIESLSGEQPIIPYYLNILRAWQLQSAVMVPLIVRDTGIGEVCIASRSPAFFDLSDVQVVVTAAGQLAGVVERSYLSQQTDESLRRQVDQLTALMRTSRELGTSLDPNFLLQTLYVEALRATQADCGTVFLLDWNTPEGEAPAVRFVVGDAVEPQLTALELETLERGEARLISAAETEPSGQFHEGVASVLLAPVLYRGRRAGLMVLHSRAAGHFDDSAIEVTQSLASQAAMALANAVQYGEQMRHGRLLKRELETLGKLFQVFQGLQHERSLEASLRVIAEAIQEATPFQSVLISVFRPESAALQRVAAAGIPGETWDELRSHTQPWSAIQSLLAEEYRSGMVYYIPMDKHPVVPPDVHTVTLLPESERQGPDAWHPEDFLLVPLYNAAGEPLGLMSLDAPSDGRRPDRPTFEALELFGMQASLEIENARLIDELEAGKQALEADHQKISQELHAANLQLPLLQDRVSEQSASIELLERQTRRLRAGLGMAVLSGQQADVQSVLRTVAHELLESFDLQAVLIGESTAAGPRLVATIGNVPPDAHPEALFGQRNPLRQLLEDGQTLLISNLPDDPNWKDNPLLASLEARCCIGLPLVAGERLQAGLLAVGNSTLPPFEAEDRRFFSQLSSQVGVALQNLQLLSETRHHLHEVGLLLEFSRKLGGLDPAGILRSLVESVRQVITEAGTAWVGLWDARTQALIPQAAAGYADNQALLALRFSAQAGSLPVRTFLAGRPQRVREVRFAQDYCLPSEDLLSYRRATGGALPISNLLVPFGGGEGVQGLLVLENFTLAEAFDAQEDEDLVASLTRQAVLALENARLFAAAENRAAQLQALTQVAGIITSSLRSEELIDSLLLHLRSVVPYDTATLWLRDGEQLLVAATGGFSDDEIRLGLAVSITDSLLFQEMIATGRAISVANVAQDPRFPSLVEPRHLAWIGIPLISKSELVGVIALEKSEAEFYTPEHVRVAATFASQAAVSLENARLFEESVGRAAELDERSQRLALLNSLSTGLAASLDTEKILQAALEHLEDALDCARVAAVLLSGSNQALLQAEFPQPEGVILPLALPDLPLWNRLSESLGIFSASDVLSEPELEPLVESYFIDRQVRSLLMVPLAAGDSLYGWLWVQRMETYRFNSQEIEMACTISNQAAISLQNAGLFAQTRRLTEELEQRVEERTQELRREHKNTETLLRIITELSASLDLNHVLTRSLEVLNETLEADQSLILIAGGHEQVYQAGESLSGAQPEDETSCERQVSHWVIRHRAAALVEDIAADARWSLPEDAGPGFRSLLAVPLVMGEEVLGSLLLLHRQANRFMVEQVSLVEAAARQIGVAVNNAELFNLIRDQAENLGAMLREQQIEANQSRAILEAVADGVLVTDDSMQVTLFNASAERILNLEAGRIVGQPLDSFSGLFGKVAHSWIQTIRCWSEDPESYQGETYAEQITLEDRRVVSVHLAPVIWRSTLLGTVSIFRDITHEVQVDRLKSEFVANVSHELRTPMTSIKGYIEILLMGAAGHVNEQQRHFLEVVKGNTERLNALVNDILDISRIEAGRETLSFSALNLREIAEDVLADVQRRAKEENKPISFVLEIEPGLPAAVGDYDRVRQVLGNLVANGYCYTPASGKVEVSISADNGSEIRVDIRDNGIGISAKDRERMFERFYRGEDPLVLATSGTGLGLALSKTLIEMQRGRIWYESSGVPGQGSVFSFTLPVYQSEVEDG